MDTKEVYIGNGVTINPTVNENVVYYLDMDKLEKIILEKGTVTVGASGDWFFTARKITKEQLEKIKQCREYLLRASCWSKFSVEIDGDRQDCTIEIPVNTHKLAFANGFTMGIGKMDIWVHNAYWRITEFPYEKIKACAEELDNIIKKYENNEER